MTALCLFILTHGEGRAQSTPAQPVPSDHAPLPPQALTDEAEALIYMDVEINGQAADSGALFVRRGASLYGRLADVETWRLMIDHAQRISTEGQIFVTLADIPGVAIRVDEQRQVLKITASPAAFRPTSRNLSGERITPTAGAFSAFVNYDLSVRTDGGMRSSAYLETGVSDDWGLAINRMTLDQRDGGMRATRLDSYVLRDDPASFTRLAIGDTVTGVSGWARAIRYGGLRIGTEFSLQPDFITFPVPLVTGTNIVPSQIDILVNNVLQYRTQAEQGAFSINNLPLISGAGEIQLQVRDILGVERQITTSYYVSRDQLKPGLSDWSLEAGAARRGYGIHSFDYSAAFASAGYRRGLRDWLTAGGRLAVSRRAQALGAEATMTLATLAELSGAAAISTGEAGTGVRYSIAARRIGTIWNASLSYEHSTPHFRQPGVEGTQFESRSRLQAAAGLVLGPWGSLSATFARVDYADHQSVHLLSANYSVGLRNIGYLNAFALHSRSNRAERESSVGLGITIPLGIRSSAYAQVDGRNRRAEMRLTPPSDTGLGYRVAISRGTFDSNEGELAWRASTRDYRLQIARSEGRNAARLLVRGGFVWTGGVMIAGRDLGDAMALVTVPGSPGVGIYDDNRLVARTDLRGRALITGLRAYTANRLSLDPSDIPIGNSLKQMALTVVPRMKGTATARFDTDRLHPATVLLQLPDGSPVEPGSPVTIAGQQKQSFVGFGGEIFVDNLVAPLRIMIETPWGRCAAVISPPADSAGPLPRIGPEPCTMVEQ